MTTNGRNDNQINGESMADSFEPSAPVNDSRRRFGRSGLVASGVLATLVSRPVLGTQVCKSPSGFLSGNLSTHGKPPICMGRSPGYWKNRTNWPIPNRKTCLFSSVFTCKSGTGYKTVTMFDLLSHKSFDSQNLGMHLVAAYLNAKAGWTPFLTVERIQSMFSEWSATGYFAPTAGVKWNAAQIVDYIQRTQD